VKVFQPTNERRTRVISVGGAQPQSTCSWSDVTASGRSLALARPRLEIG